MASSTNPTSPGLPLWGKLVATLTLLSFLCLGWCHVMGWTAPPSEGRSFGVVWLGMAPLAVWAACTLTDKPTPWAAVGRTITALFGRDK